MKIKDGTILNIGIFFNSRKKELTKKKGREKRKEDRETNKEKTHNYSL